MSNVLCNLVDSLRISGYADRGILLGGSVSNPRDNVYGGVIVVFHQTEHSILGLQLNRVISEISLRSIVENLGFDSDFVSDQDFVYYGGSIGTNRMHFVHSLDWCGMSTISLNREVGITSDLSILSALSAGQGPNKFRACAGNWRWDIDTLRDQIFHLDPEVDSVNHRWEVAPIRSDLLFDHDGRQQWDRVLRASALMQKSRYF